MACAIFAGRSTFWSELVGATTTNSTRKVPVADAGAASPFAAAPDSTWMSARDKPRSAWGTPSAVIKGWA